MDQKQVSYALGLGIGQNLLGMGAKDIDIDEFAHGVKDVLEDKKPELDHKTAQIIVSQYIDELDKKMTAARQEANKQFLEENKKRQGVVELPSGLQYYVVNQGNVEGKRAKETDRVQCHYEGRLLDGNVFDSSYQRGEPATFGVNQVIQGWTEALQLMPEGAKWTLFIPSEMAYGAQGAGQVIPPHSALIFDVELLKIL
ncbi:MAG: FKBP-type peptidyl-prolyl cis-trans isomerase [Bacteroidaceae bacterium]|nr:FKBP-type peptidyl-prolyl cis-trans isomerase [Bacteroidaceae bacterium]